MNTIIVRSTIICAASFFMFSDAKLVHVKKADELKAITDTKPVVLKFSASWCGACTAVKKQFHDVTEDPTLQEIGFVEVNVDEAPELSSQYQVEGIPAFVFIEKGGKVKDQVVGVASVQNFGETFKKDIHRIFDKVDASSTTVKSGDNEQQAACDCDDSHCEKGFLKSIWCAIYNFFMSIINGIKNLFGF